MDSQKPILPCCLSAQNFVSELIFILFPMFHLSNILKCLTKKKKSYVNTSLLSSVHIEQLRKVRDLRFLHQHYGYNAAAQLFAI